MSVDNDQVLLEIAYNGTSEKLLSSLADAPEMQRLADPVSVPVPVIAPVPSTPSLDTSISPTPSTSESQSIQPQAAFAWRKIDSQ